MNETWFKTESYSIKISTVCVVKVTEKTVTVRSKVFQIGKGPEKFHERRADKRSTHDNFFPTWEEAHAHLLDRTERQLESVRRRLALAQSEHGNVKGMKKPEATALQEGM